MGEKNPIKYAIRIKMIRSFFFWSNVCLRRSLKQSDAKINSFFFLVGKKFIIKEMSAWKIFVAHSVTVCQILLTIPIIITLVYIMLIIFRARVFCFFRINTREIWCFATHRPFYPRRIKLKSNQSEIWNKN